jgi:hypothetical protein
MTITTTHFEVKTRDGSLDTVMTGANTEIYMNGVKLDNVTDFKLEIPARGVAKITLQMVGTVSVIGKFEDVHLEMMRLVPESKTVEND